MLSDQDVIAWWVAIVLGVVVVLAVVALLTLLVRFVTVIDRRVAEIRDTLSAITANTDSTALIDPTGDAVDRVLAEGLQHHLFLGRAYGAIPTPAPGGPSS
jgi:Na+-transporting methylmalonyl-CoA/oxaloacetate decarboxylase gamma subunit